MKMPESEARLVAIVKFAQGLHARPAVQLVETAMAFSSDIQIIKDDLAVDAKSVLQVLTLGATCGTSLTVIARGSDAEAAVKAVTEIIESEHDEVAKPDTSNAGSDLL